MARLGPAIGCRGGDSRTGAADWQARADGHAARCRVADVTDTGSSCDRRKRGCRPAARLSSIDSANSFFSLRFSSSSIRSRLASDTSMPPYLLFQLYTVASEMPCLRARSAGFAPASCSRRTAMICSSVNLPRFIVHPAPVLWNESAAVGVTSPKACCQCDRRARDERHAVLQEFELVINLTTAKALGLTMPPRSSPAP